MLSGLPSASFDFSKTSTKPELQQSFGTYCCFVLNSGCQMLLHCSNNRFIECNDGSKKSITRSRDRNSTIPYEINVATIAAAGQVSRDWDLYRYSESSGIPLLWLVNCIFLIMAFRFSFTLNSKSTQILAWWPLSIMNRLKTLFPRQKGSCWSNKWGHPRWIPCLDILRILPLVHFINPLDTHICSRNCPVKHSIPRSYVVGGVVQWRARVRPRRMLP